VRDEHGIYYVIVTNEAQLLISSFKKLLTKLNVVVIGDIEVYGHSMHSLVLQESPIYRTIIWKEFESTRVEWTKDNWIAIKEKSPGQSAPASKPTLPQRPYFPPPHVRPIVFGPDAPPTISEQYQIDLKRREQLKRISQNARGSSQGSSVDDDLSSVAGDDSSSVGTDQKYKRCMDEEVQPTRVVRTRRQTDFFRICDDEAADRTFKGSDAEDSYYNTESDNECGFEEEPDNGEVGPVNTATLILFDGAKMPCSHPQYKHTRTRYGFKSSQMDNWPDKEAWQTIGVRSYEEVVDATGARNVVIRFKPRIQICVFQKRLDFLKVSVDVIETFGFKFKTSLRNSNILQAVHNPDYPSIEWRTDTEPGVSGKSIISHPCFTL